MLQELTIQATYIELKRDKSGKTYFLILDRDTYQAYFVFPKRAKGWYDLAIKWAIIKEVWIRFDEKRKVRALKVMKVYPRFPKQRGREYLSIGIKAGL